MDFFGISSAKIILILIIAIVLLGPDQVPQMVRTVGKFIRDFRRFTSEMTKEFDEATGDLRKEFTETVGGLRSEIEQTQSDLRSQLNPLTDAFRDPLGMTTQAATAEPVPVSVGGATVGTASFGAFADSPTLADVNPLATQTPTYTPPQPLTYETPAATTGEPSYTFNGNGNGSSNGVTHGTNDPTPHESGMNGNATNGFRWLNGNGNGTFTAPHATKADPFADLVALAPHAVPEPAITTVTTVTEAEPVHVASFAPTTEDALPAPLAPIPVVSEVPPAPVALVPRPIGRSVAGTKYGRKRA